MTIKYPVKRSAPGRAGPNTSLVLGSATWCWYGLMFYQLRQKTHPTPHLHYIHQETHLICNQVTTKCASSPPVGNCESTSPPYLQNIKLQPFNKNIDENKKRKKIDKYRYDGQLTYEANNQTASMFNTILQCSAVQQYHWHLYCCNLILHNLDICCW